MTKACITGKRNSIFYGIKRNGGGLIPHAKRVKYETSIDKAALDPANFTWMPIGDVCNQVPQDLCDKMVELQQQLLLRIRGGAVTKEKHKANEGTSIGMTAVDGGIHSRGGNSGALHWNRNICGADLGKDEEAVPLQREIIDTLRAIVEAAFGEKDWYKTFKEMTKDIPPERLLPGGLPCSHSWFTRSPAVRQVHFDDDTILGGFCFAATPVDGGELVYYTENGARRIHLGNCNIIGGRWPKFAHCNEAVVAGERYSFVLYLDARVTSIKYRRITRKNELELLYD